jgi:hypothetical protein
VHNLRSSSMPAFTSISECIVSFQPPTELSAFVKDSDTPNDYELAEIEEQVQTILLGMAHKLTEDDAKFLDDTWMDTYNVVHDGVAFHSVTARGEEIQDESYTLAASLSYSWTYLSSIYLSLAGSCLLCKNQVTLADDVTGPKKRSFSMQGLHHDKATNPAIIHHLNARCARRFKRALFLPLVPSKTAINLPRHCYASGGSCSKHRSRLDWGSRTHG